MGSGLYLPEEFRDNCGFGLLAHTEGKKSHDLLQKAIGALTCMTHRGGIAADGRTGDGCGLLIQLPDALFRAISQTTFQQTLPSLYAVGMVFLSQDPELAAHARHTMTEQLDRYGLETIGWRVVPTNADCLGPIALQQLPQIEQVFVAPRREMDRRQLEAQLFMSHRQISQRLQDDTDFYICSLSSRTITYKGLMMPADLASFYTDLDDTRCETAICVFHQRFSTNTMPRWPLAQPFRLLAHNGEINTITGNRNWAKARANKFQSELLPDLHEIRPLVNATGSDSSALDNMLEILVTGGVDLYRALRMLIPPAWQNTDTLDANLRAFYEYNSMHMESWDGPAGLVISDGRYAVCALDRNGLRPSRWVKTNDGLLIVASEVGVCDYAADEVIAKGRVGPGQILALDTETGEFLEANAVDLMLKGRQPYKHWLREHGFRLRSRFIEEEKRIEELCGDALLAEQKRFQITREERDQVIRPLVENGQEAVGSMGDDTPMAVLSQKVRPAYDFFRQLFAQVTNPPIDPLREAVVMSLETCLGRELNVFEETPEHAARLILKSPILSTSKFLRLITGEHKLADLKVTTLNLGYDSGLGLQQALVALCDRAEQSVRDGNVIVHLTDRNQPMGQPIMPAALATGAVQHRLIEKGLRTDANIIVETGTARDPHHFAVLLGFGATAVYPWLVYEVIREMIGEGHVSDAMAAYKSYRQGIDKGVLKILSKMGISTISSYRGAQLFEAVGISKEVVDLCFRGVKSRIEGMRFEDFHQDQMALMREASLINKPLSAGGAIKYVHNGEYHAFNPDVVQTLQRAVNTGDYKVWREYSALVNKRPVAMLRDLLQPISDREPIPIDQVEPISAIVRRFDSAAMSLGALSPEAHEALAQAMNRLGGRSNSGEGGEDPARFGTDKVSKIKQIASGRFGVTPEYLVNAEVLQIKVAQGAKPGEGGQLPGSKVNALIARLRYSVPGVTLISPPPHHDIYSIEDLAQLIFDLKQVNPQALVSVKLVSEPGVGTIAAGVAKAYADLITISGYDGGTAASPLTSIRYAGSPWELGLAEAQQALQLNDLRGKIRLQVDGGLKTGLDVIKAALLGAESFGFGTTPMVALGCKYLRICHLNNCATGVATQNQQLRDQHFHGTVERVTHFFTFLAQEVRELLAQMGYRSLDELIGQCRLLKPKTEGLTPRQANLDFSQILAGATIAKDKPVTCEQSSNPPFDKGALAERMVADMLPAIEAKAGGEFRYTIGNCDRSIGARLSGEIARRHGNQGMAEQPITVKLTGSAGQSFGVWNAGGLHMVLEGDANDYVGKGMTGGKLVIRPALESQFASDNAVIIGNTCLYGATGGQLFAAGRAGERLAVRNSGATVVVEGAGDHCCEYMTGGQVTVLGSTGGNFGAGMTGGFAYVLDRERNFVDCYNHELVDIHRIDSYAMEDHRSNLYGIVEEYVRETGSDWGQRILDDFEDYSSLFWLVKPKAASLDTLLANTRGRPE